MKKGIFLPIVTLLAAVFILFSTAWCLRDITAENARRDHLRLLKTLLPGCTEFSKEDYSDDTVRSVHRGDIGFVIETVTYGYAGEITVLVGVSNQGKVTGLVVRDMDETYGLGREALTDVEFLKQFLNSSGTFAVATQGADAFSGATGETESTGDTVDVDAITGATVTSKAVIRCVNAAVGYVTGADAESSATSWGG